MKQATKGEKNPSQLFNTSKQTEILKVSFTTHFYLFKTIITDSYKGKRESADGGPFQLKPLPEPNL